MGLVEQARGGSSFAQLYAALALRAFGPDLQKNALWQSLDEPGRAEWRKLLDSRKFYDPATRKLIGKPENYLGVAARIAATSHELGLGPDRAALDALLDRAAEPFADGRLYADDDPPHGRFDRYSNEYARYVFEAAGIAGRQDIQERLRPSLRRQMRLYWDLVAPDGYAYPWGRSLGVVSYLDSVEIAAFLADEPDLRPAPLPDLAAVFAAAWRSLRADYRDDAHLLSIFAPGRGNYAYISREREWQQTAGFFGKLTAAQARFFRALEREGVDDYPWRGAASAGRALRVVRRRRPPGGRVGGAARPAAVRACPSRPDRSRDSPTTCRRRTACPASRRPSSTSLPALTTFLDLADGRTLVAGDGADAIEPDPGGLAVTARWKRWALVGARSGAREEPGVTSVVSWRLDGDRLVRTETLSADRPLRLRGARISVPLTGADVKQEKDVFVARGREGTLRVSARFQGAAVRASIRPTGDAPEGRGARLGVPVQSSTKPQSSRSRRTVRSGRRSCSRFRPRRAHDRRRRDHHRRALRRARHGPHARPVALGRARPHQRAPPALRPHRPRRGRRRRSRFPTANHETGLVLLRGSATVDTEGGPYAARAVRRALRPVPGDGRGPSGDGAAATSRRSPRRSSGRHPVQLVRFADVQKDPSLHFNAGGPSSKRDLNVLIGKNVAARAASWPASRSASRATGRRGRRTSTRDARRGLPLHRHAGAGVRHSARLHRPREPELATIVREGDVVMMPQGYHPNVAAPGGSINFLWMMAAVREDDDRQYGVVNVQPEFAQSRLRPRRGARMTPMNARAVGPASATGAAFPSRTLAEGITRQMVVGDRLMVCRLRFAARTCHDAARAPARADHARRAGPRRLLRRRRASATAGPGDVLLFPSGIQHGATMLDEEVVLDRHLLAAARRLPGRAGRDAMTCFSTSTGRRRS